MFTRAEYGVTAQRLILVRLYDGEEPAGEFEDSGSGLDLDDAGLLDKAKTFALALAVDYDIDESKVSHNPAI